MLKREREVTDMDQILSILDRGCVMHLGLSDDGQPYVVPMNYGYIYKNEKLVLYLHGAKEGYKYEVIQKNPKVSFSIECGVNPFEGKTACQYGMTYECMLGKGIAEVTDDVDEKIKALTLLMKTQTGQDFTFNDKLVSIVKVIKITVTEFSAKKRPLPGR